MARYSKTLWDTNTIYNPTNMNHIEQGIYDADLREGGTINGNLGIDRPSSNTSEQITWLQLGNNVAKGVVGNSTGKLAIYGDKNSAVILQTVGDMTSGNKTIKLPDQAGTLALTSDYFGGYKCAIESFTNNSTGFKSWSNSHAIFKVSHNIITNSGFRPIIAVRTGGSESYDWTIISTTPSTNADEVDCWTTRATAPNSFMITIMYLYA